MAARTEALANPELLVWARESAGYDRGAAAHRGKVKLDQLDSWEKGLARPSVPQLRKLAFIYRRPLAFFYLPSPPAGIEHVRDFRRLPEGLGVRELSPELRLAIRRCHERREVALELLDEADEGVPAFTASVSLNEEPEEVGKRLASLLGGDGLLGEVARGAYSALNAWRRRVEAVGVLVFQAAGISVTEVRGFSIAERPLPAVAVNISDAPYARVFTLLHELTHVMLGAEGVCDVKEDRADDTYEGKVETFCNHVAAATLVPKSAIWERLIPRYRDEWPDDEIAGLSRTFGVSREVITRRLHTLGLASRRYYESKRAQFAREYALQAKQLKDRGGFAPPHRVALSEAGPTYARLVMEAYQSERITSSDVCDYLGVRTKHFADIQKDLWRGSGEVSGEL